MQLKNATHLALVRLSADASAPPADPAALVPGLAQAGVHEIAEARYGDMPSVAGFAVAALRSARPGALLWITEARARREHGRLSGHGALALGLDPGRILSVAVSKGVEALWCVEEGLRSGAVSAVVAELSEADFTATRRLSLAAEATGVPALLLMDHRRGGATAAQSRWRVSPAPSAPEPYDPRAPGAARWRVVVERARMAPGAVGRRVDLEVDDATHSLRVVPELAARPARQGRRVDEGLRRAG